MRSSGRILDTVDFMDIPEYGLLWHIAAPLPNGEDIQSLAVFNNKIYAGTNGTGLLFEWDGADSWVQVASQAHAWDYAILSLVVLGADLYGTTGGRGNLLKWNGSNAWIQVAPMLGSVDWLNCSVVLNGEIYAGGAGGELLKWNGSDAWIQVADLGSDNIECLTVMNGKIYGGTAGAKLYEFNGTDAWVVVATQAGGDETWVEALTVLNGEIYGSTGSHGRLYKWNGSDAWIQVAGQYGTMAWVDSLAVVDGEIYGSGYPSKLLKWNGSDAWSLVSEEPDDGESYSITVDNGTIYCGTDSGNLLETYTRFANIADRSRCGNTGIAADTVLIKLPSGICAVAFESATSRVEVIKNKSINNLHRFTFSTWFYITGAGTGNIGYIFDKTQRYLRVNAESIIEFAQMFTTAAGQWVSLSTHAFTAGWHHLHVSYDDSSVDNDPEICIDGVSIALTESNTPAGALLSDAAFNLTIGNSNIPQYYLNGRLAMIKMKNYIRTEPQALAEFNSTRHWFGV